MLQRSQGGRRVIFSIWYRSGIIAVPVGLFMWKVLQKIRIKMEMVL